MKTTICLLLVFAGVYGAAAAEPNSAATCSRFSLGAYLSYWRAVDLDYFDLDGAFGVGGLGQYRLADWLALEARLSVFVAGDSTDHHVEGQGWYKDTITVAAVPVEIGLLATWPLGDKLTFYGGPGAGFYFFDGEFSVEHGPWKAKTNLDFEHSPGGYALLGARAQLARHVALFLEAKYTWVATKWRPAPQLVGTHLDSPRVDKVSVDFSGIAVNAGMVFTF